MECWTDCERHVQSKKKKQNEKKEKSREECFDICKIIWSPFIQSRFLAIRCRLLSRFAKFFSSRQASLRIGVQLPQRSDLQKSVSDRLPRRGTDSPTWREAITSFYIEVNRVLAAIFQLLEGWGQGQTLITTQNGTQQFLR